MRFVQDHRRLIRQHRTVRAVAQSEIGKKQMMIDDDDVGVERAQAHPREKARLEVRTLLAETSIRSRVDVSPKRQVLRQGRKLRSITGFSFANPTRDFIKLIDLFEAGEHGHALGALDAMQTCVVVTALHGRGAKLLWQNVVKKRNVFVDQLLLQILCARRDDDARAATARRRDRRYQISERLAGAGAGFDDEVMLLLKRAQHRLSYFTLP